MSDCALCPERHSGYAQWTCAHCNDAATERTAPELWRALWWRKLIRAGHPLEQSGLDFWEMWLIGAIEEFEDERNRQSRAG